MTVVLREPFEARLQRDSATQISLQRYAGQVVRVGGEDVIVPSAGLTRASSANLISATGTDSGGAMAVDTLYYVYVSNSKATFSPSSIRASATAPTAFNGVKYLGVSGNALNWKFVGWVRTIDNAGAANFADSVTQRLVINYYNRLALKMKATPGYVDDNAANSYTFGSATWAPINGGTGDFLDYISNGEDGVIATFQSSFRYSTTNQVGLGVGADSTTTADSHVFIDTRDAAKDDFLSGSDSISLAEGYRRLNLLMHNFGGGTVTVYADIGRDGGSVDAPVTLMAAIIMG